MSDDPTPRSTYNAVIEQVATHFDGWQLAPDAHPDCYRVWRQLNDAEGRTIHLSGGGYGNYGRLSITGSYPTHIHACPSITCSAARNPAAIAADIQRRFLPDYLAAYAKAFAVDAENNQREERRAATANRFATMIDGQPVKASRYRQIGHNPMVCAGRIPRPYDPKNPQPEIIVSSSDPYRADEIRQVTVSIERLTEAQAETLLYAINALIPAVK